jgi:hypothetical protein
MTTAISPVTQTPGGKARAAVSSGGAGAAGVSDRSVMARFSAPWHG